jgi:hypothetical protein
MSFLVLNSITDTRSDPDTADAFDLLVQSLAKNVRDMKTFAPKGDLQHVYVQFQFDCKTVPNTVRGLRVARYSKKHAHIEAYVEVTLEEFRPLSMRNRCELLVKKLDVALEAVSRALDGKVQNNLDELLKAVRESGRAWCEHG